MALEPSLPFRHLICLGSWPLPKLDTRAYGVHREIFGLYQEADHAACASARSLWGRGRLHLVFGICRLSECEHYASIISNSFVCNHHIRVVFRVRASILVRGDMGTLIILCAVGTDYSHLLARAIVSRLHANFLCDSHNYFGCIIVIILCLVAVEARQMCTGLRQHYFDLGIYSYFLPILT